ncbi:MAG: hypothetical protein Q9168_007780 [Polycauliona sp. 1 TL-2023]
MPASSESEPALAPPHGVVSNLKDPPSQAYIVIIITTIVLCLTTPVLFIRLYTRQLINHKLWWDDALDYGGGVDIWNVSKAQHVRFTKVHTPFEEGIVLEANVTEKLFHNIEIVARISMFFTKASILLLYHRIFIVSNSTRSGTWWAIWFVFWYNLLYALALVLTVATECVGKPADVIEKGECLNQYAVLICASTINVVSDLMILVIPITAIWGLQMAKNKKIHISFLFAFGSLIVEQMVGIIVACVPVFPSLVRHIFEKKSGPGTGSPGKKNAINSFFARRQESKTSAPLSDTTGQYSVQGDYHELGDLEGGRRQKKPLAPSCKLDAK